MKKVVRVSSRRKSADKRSRSNLKNENTTTHSVDSYGVIGAAKAESKSNGQCAEDSSFEIRIDLEKERMLSQQQHISRSAIASGRDHEVA